MIEIQTGYCVCCGTPQIVSVAGAQREADMLATAKCKCDGAIQARALAQVHQAVLDIVGDEAERDGYGELQLGAVQTIETLVRAVAEKSVAGAQLTLSDGSRVVIRTGKDGLEVRRERRKVRVGGEQPMTDGEMARLLGDRVPMRQASDAPGAGE